MNMNRYMKAEFAVIHLFDGLASEADRLLFSFPVFVPTKITVLYPVPVQDPASEAPELNRKKHRARDRAITTSALKEHEKRKN
ncbi:hypothetical protein TNCV_4924661 [Trichonephila clavipes]|nr:hypothetical protein TNCV_4924661 [Trichonephila clavipes]